MFFSADGIFYNKIIENFDEVNILGQILDNTVARSSTDDGVYAYDFGNASVAMRSTLAGDTLTVMAIAIKNLGTHAQQSKELCNCENELDQRIKNHISNLKKQFKSEAGRALKVKQVKDSESTSVEMLNHYAVTRPAYVRRFISFEIA